MDKKPEDTPIHQPSIPAGQHVVFNGTAYQLLVELTESIRRDMREMEQRIVAGFDQRFQQHSKEHARIRFDMRARTKNFEDRIKALEEDDEADDIAAARAAGRGDFQAQVLFFIRANWKWLVILGSLVLSWVLGKEIGIDIP